MPLCCSVSMFFCICYYHTFNLQPTSYEYLLFFPITKLATNKNIVLLLITQIIFNSSSLASQTAMTQHRLDSALGLGCRGGMETVLASLRIPATHIHRICALLPPVESNVVRWRQVSRGIAYMAIFKTGRNFNSNTGHFYITFEYKTHLNFGGNFSKKKVRLIVHKIWYFNTNFQFQCF